MHSKWDHVESTSVSHCQCFRGGGGLVDLMPVFLRHVTLMYWAIPMPNFHLLGVILGLLSLVCCLHSKSSLFLDPLNPSLFQP
jgi:hypothetical protein